jgi:hypothetical protein
MLHPQGGDNMSDLLATRCSSISQQLIQRQRTKCGRYRNWAERLPGSLEDLRTNVSIQTMILTIERRLLPAAVPTELSFPTLYPSTDTGNAIHSQEIGLPSMSSRKLTPRPSGDSVSLDSSNRSLVQSDDGHGYYTGLTWSQN